MQHTQDFDCLGVHPVSHNVGRPDHNQFPYSCTPAGTANFRKTNQPCNRAKNKTDLIIGRYRIVVSDVRPSGRQIPKRRDGPN